MFPSSPAPSNCSSGTPQMQLDLYDPASTSFNQNSFKELDDYYASSSNVSTPPGREEVLNALSQLYSANPRLPGRAARQQTSPGQQLVFGDTQSHFPVDMDNFRPSPTAYKNHNPAPVAPIPVRRPPSPPRFLPPSHPPPHTNQTSFSHNNQLDGRDFLTCPIPIQPVSKSDDPSRQEGPPVTPAPPKRQPSQRVSSCSSKKRKTGKAVNYDQVVRAFLYFSFLPRC